MYEMKVKRINKESPLRYYFISFIPLTYLCLFLSSFSFFINFNKLKYNSDLSKKKNRKRLEGVEHV